MESDFSAIALAAQAVDAFFLGLYLAVAARTLTFDRESMTSECIISSFWIVVTALGLTVLSLGSNDPFHAAAPALLFLQTGFACGARREGEECSA